MGLGVNTGKAFHPFVEDSIVSVGWTNFLQDSFPLPSDQNAIIFDMPCYIASGPREIEKTWRQFFNGVFSSVRDTLGHGMDVVLCFDKPDSGRPNPAKWMTQEKRSKASAKREFIVDGNIIDKDEAMRMSEEEVRRLSVDAPVPRFWSLAWGACRDTRALILQLMVKTFISYLSSFSCPQTWKGRRVIIDGDMTPNGIPFAVLIGDASRPFVPPEEDAARRGAGEYDPSPSDAGLLPLIHPEDIEVKSSIRFQRLWWLANDHIEADVSMSVMVRGLMHEYLRFGVVSLDTDQWVIDTLLIARGHMDGWLRDARDRGFSLFLHTIRSKETYDMLRCYDNWVTRFPSHFRAPGADEGDTLDLTFAFFVILCGTDFVNKPWGNIGPKTALEAWEKMLCDKGRDTVVLSEHRDSIVLDETKGIDVLGAGVVRYVMIGKVAGFCNKSYEEIITELAASKSKVNIPPLAEFVTTLRLALYNITYWFFYDRPDLVPDSLDKDVFGYSLCGLRLVPDAGDSSRKNVEFGKVYFTSPSVAFTFSSLRRAQDPSRIPKPCVQDIQSCE